MPPFTQPSISVSAKARRVGNFGKFLPRDLPANQRRVAEILTLQTVHGLTLGDAALVQKYSLGLINKKRSKKGRSVSGSRLRYKVWVNPPRWRDLHLYMKVLYFQRALTVIGPTVAMTIRASDALKDRARNNPAGITSHCQKALARHLKHVFGRQVHFWFMVETDSPTMDLTESNFHLHGGVRLDLNKSTAEKLTATVDRLLKPVDGRFRRHAAKFEPIYDGTGWARYAAKDLFKRLRLGGFGRTNPDAATQEVRKRAKKLYEAEVRELQRVFTV